MKDISDVESQYCERLENRIDGRIWTFIGVLNVIVQIYSAKALTGEGEIIMAMDILAYAFGIIALAAGIKCFVDENWGEKMHRESEDSADVQDMTQDEKIA